MTGGFAPGGERIAVSKRRFHVSELSAGVVQLDPKQSHHLRHVLRCSAGEQVELFDDAGRTGVAIVRGDFLAAGESVLLEVQSVHTPAAAVDLLIASAVPKGNRADWMVEKLSELGVTRWIPLRSQRSVVHPSGTGKLDRWRRIAEESAKQCRRIGVMAIDELTDLSRLLETIGGDGGESVPAGCLLSPHASQTLIEALTQGGPVRLLIGPEGGFTEAEEAQMARAGFVPARLGSTILRIETAAVAAAAVAAAWALGQGRISASG